MRRRLAKRLLLTAVVILAWFAVHTAVILTDGLSDELKQADVAVVLGNKVEESGEPSERLKARLDKAAELYDKGYFDHIIVSGGIGQEGFDEAQVMKSYLVQAGIPEESIIEDNKGINSDWTARNAARIMDEAGWESAMVISQYFHISRTKLAFKRMDIGPLYGAHADYYELRDVYSILREFPAYYKYLWKSVFRNSSIDGIYWQAKFT